MDQSLVQVLTVVISLVVALILWVLGQGARYLSARRKESLLATALFSLNQVVADVVKELNQTVVAELKAKSADGKLTPDEAVQIRNKAIELVLLRLKSETLKIVGEALGPIVAVITSKIEAAVWDSKHPRPLA
ncbi:MAG: hypothetical protein ACUVRM_09490 [Bacillota bacterium]